MTGVLIPVSAGYDPREAIALLPDNATDLELDLSLTLERLSSIPIDLSVLFDADRCPLELLPFLAWTVSVDYWNSDWPEEMKRKVTKASLQLHFKKGTRSAVERVMALLGLDDGDLVEWWQNKVPDGFGNSMAPRTFKLALPEGHRGLDSMAKQEMLRDMIAAVKPLTAWWHVQIDATATLPQPMVVSEFGVLKDFTPSLLTDSFSGALDMHTLIYGRIRQLVTPDVPFDTPIYEGADAVVANHGLRQIPPDAAVNVVRNVVVGANVDPNLGTISFEVAMPYVQTIQVDARMSMRTAETPKIADVDANYHTLVVTALQGKVGDSELAIVPAKYVAALVSNIPYREQEKPIMKIVGNYIPPEFFMELGKLTAPPSYLPKGAARVNGLARLTQITERGTITGITFGFRYAPKGYVYGEFINPHPQLAVNIARNTFPKGLVASTARLTDPEISLAKGTTAAIVTAITQKGVPACDCGNFPMKPGGSVFGIIHDQR